MGKGQGLVKGTDQNVHTGLTRVVFLSKDAGPASKLPIQPKAKLKLINC